MTSREYRAAGRRLEKYRRQVRPRSHWVIYFSVLLIFLIIGLFVYTVKVTSANTSRQNVAVLDAMSSDNAEDNAHHLDVLEGQQR